MQGSTTYRAFIPSHFNKLCGLQQFTDRLYIAILCIEIYHGKTLHYNIMYRNLPWNNTTLQYYV